MRPARHSFAVVDEVDSILIDEARTPLIISGPTQDEVKWYGEFAKLARTLVQDVDYEVDEKKRTISVLEPGITKVEDHLGIENLYESVNTPLISFLNNSIKAKELFRNDKEYVVIDGEVLIVDEHTGRMLAGRRYNDGLHQAIEAKEGVEVREEYQTLATITLQNYFRLYEKLSGMTGTAMTEASEFDKIYSLGVVPIPTNKPMARVDQADLVYRTEEAKYDAVVDDIAERHEKGQPVLVGTVSVEKSEHLSGKLRKRGIPHSVLNAKVHADEAKIVAHGRPQGRGHRRHQHGRSRHRHHARRLGRVPRRPGAAQAGPRARRRDRARSTRPPGRPWSSGSRPRSATSTTRSARLGGLYVVGTERHESRRIDNQLRGRSGRQGDPGESRFYLSLEDELMRLFKSDWVDRVLQVLKIPDDVPIENKRVTSAIANAQGQVESQNFESRKNVLKYDDVMDRQRKVIYAERREVLEGKDLQEQIRTFLDDTVTGYVMGATEEFAEEWDLDALWTALRQIYPVTVDQEALDGGGRRRRATSTATSSSRRSRPTPTRRTTRREAEIGEEVMRELERRVVLSVLDRKWREHLYEMDYLREGIYLRAYSQRDPLVEYQREGFDMFAAMMDGIKEESVGFLFNLDVQVEEEQEGEDDVEVEVVEPMRQPSRWRAQLPSAEQPRRSGPRASTGRSPAEPLLLGPERGRRGRGRVGPRPRPRTSSPASAATTSAPAAPARSTSSATAAPGGPTGSDRPDQRLG